MSKPAILYLCNGEKCPPEIKDCRRPNSERLCFHTTDVRFSKNGPVENFEKLDKDPRFDKVKFKDSVLYIEKVL
jgi:hypothetical protein